MATDRREPRVIVVGGGIGGLATALSLHDAGIPVRLFEAVETVRPLGVGINLLPHAVRELTELGLQDRLLATGIETAELIYANRHGQEIWREPRGRAAGYRWPQVSIHRGALQMILYAAAKQRLGDAVATGRRLVAVEDAPAGVTAVFRRTDGGEERATGDVLVGADGIHSTVRAMLVPGEGPPKWNGCILWRATTLGEPFLGGRSMVMAGHQDQKFVCYPIGREEAERGRSLINWIAELRFRDRRDFAREDWNRPGRLADFLPAFEDWRFGWLDVPGVIRGAEAVYEFPMVDRDPLDAWTRGRVTLLGDAAHPMYPIGSNGASQAIVDARVLARAMALEDDADAALAAYEAERRPATAAVVLANRRNGPEEVLQTVHERAPDGFSDVTEAIDPAELARVATAYKRTAGFDPETLNARPSLGVPAGGAVTPPA